MSVITYLCLICFQATIGIDFLSKTMYLEDRTVSCIFMSHGVLSIRCITDYILFVSAQIGEIDFER